MFDVVFDIDNSQKYLAGSKIPIKLKPYLAALFIIYKLILEEPILLIGIPTLYYFISRVFNVGYNPTEQFRRSISKIVRTNPTFKYLRQKPKIFILGNLKSHPILAHLISFIETI